MAHRALFLSTELPPGPGGIGSHAAQVARQLERRGWNMVLMGPQDYVDPREAAAWSAQQSLRVVRLRHLPTSFLQGLWWALRLLWVLITFRPRVILASGQQMVWLAAAMTRLLRVPVIAVGHGTEFGIGSRAGKWLNRWAYGRATVAVSVSRYTEGCMLDAGIRPRRRQVIPNGADHHAFRALEVSYLEAWRRREPLAQAPRRLLVTVGNVSERKGQDVVIRALPRIIAEVAQARGGEVHYAMIGLPTREAELTHLARQLGVEDRVHFLGRLDRDDVRAFLMSSEIFVMASRHTAGGDFEGFGIAVVEAALLGVPAVVTRDSGLVEAIDPGLTGLAVSPDDADGLAGAILELLDDDDRRLAMGARARARAAQEQTWDRRGGEYDDLAHELALQVEGVDAGPETSARRPRLGFLGPHLSKHAGWVVTQNEVLMPLFAAEGLTVVGASEFEQPVARTLDMMRALWSWRASVDVVVIAVFSGRAFAIVDAVSWMVSRLGVPQVHVLHGGNFPQLVEQQPRRAARVLRRASTVVAPSPFLARSAGRLDIKTEVIPNVLDLDAYVFRHRTTLQQPIRLLWVRTFHDIYHPQMAIHALQELRRRGVDARLTLAGQDKGLEQRCRDLVIELDLIEQVDFAGFLDMSAKQRLFAEHDVYLHTNRVDNTPVTVLEACAFGLPVIATRVGGLPDLLGHDVTGLLVDSEDIEAMADAVERLAADPGLVSELSRAGRQLAERCAWSTVRERWFGLFARVIQMGR